MAASGPRLKRKALSPNQQHRTNGRAQKLGAVAYRGVEVTCGYDVGTEKMLGWKRYVMRGVECEGGLAEEGNRVRVRVRVGQ